MNTLHIPIFQVDAFTDRLFSGNPAAVCQLEDWLSDEMMQQIAAENNLSETAFFVKRADGNFDLRWFTPTIEVDLCGHATLATAHVLFEHLEYTDAEITFNTRSGALQVKKDADWYVMNFPADKLELVSTPPPELVSGIKADIQKVLRGKEDYLVILASEKEIQELNPDFRALQKLGGRGILVTAPGDDADFVSRCFFPCAGVDEDPVTGSAHTSLTPYWSEVLNKKSLLAKQISKRGGLIKCRDLNDRIELKGQAVSVLKGRFHLD